MPLEATVSRGISCKWSNMWSSGFLLLFPVKLKSRDSVVSRGICGIGFWNMLLRVYAPKRLFIAIYAPRQILFSGLVSVVSVCSKAVYGQICGHFSAATQMKLLNLTLL